MGEDELFDDLNVNEEQNTGEVGVVSVTPVNVPEPPAVDASGVKPLDDLFPEEQKEEAPKDKKGKKDSKKVEEKKPEPKEEVYEGPRTVKAYGQVLFVEENPKVTLDEIRERIVLEHGLSEFTKAETVMYLNKENGIVMPRLKFDKKG